MHSHEESYSQIWNEQDCAQHGYYSEGDADYDNFIAVQNVWLMKNFQESALLSILEKVWSKSSNPFITTLYIVSRSDDFIKLKSNGMAVNVMKGFMQWTQNRLAAKKIDIFHYLTPDVKLKAFKFISCQKNATLANLIVECYHLREGRENFIECIRNLLHSHKYVEASRNVVIFGLHDHFSTSEIAIPLLFQDKMNLAEAYIKDSHKDQIKLLQFIDSLCDYNKCAPNMHDNFIVPGTKPGNLNRKFLSKLGKRLMKSFNIPDEICPNITQSKNFGTLHYLMYKRYSENSIEINDWEDMIKDVIKNNSTIQEEFVLKLYAYGDTRSAVKWALELNISPDKMPLAVKEAIESGVDLTNINNSFGNEPGTSQQFEFWELESDKQFYELKLPLTSITIVDTKSKYIDCLDHLYKNEVIGMDAEWKPCFGIHIERVAVLQLAVKDHVYLLDIFLLNDLLDEKDWQMLVNVFENNNIIKLGFACGNDFKLLSNISPTMDQLKQKCKNLIDVKVLCDKLSKINSGPISDNSASGLSLSDLVKICFGYCLDKSCQFGNWEKRPLNESQIKYAALDAYVMLEIYEYLTMKSLEISFNLADVLRQSTVNSTPSEKTKAEKLVKKLYNAIGNVKCLTYSEPKSPKDLRIVADTMFQGLGRELRLYGVDSVILATEDEHDVAAKIALKEERIALSNGKAFERLAKLLPAHLCYNVQSQTPQEQVIEILHYFNVKVKPEDILSRCQLCNGCQYVEIPSKDLLNMKMCDEINSTRHEQYKGGSVLWRDLVIVETGVKIQISVVPDPVLQKYNIFFVCAQCGKVYWEGSHHSRAFSTRLNVIATP